VGEVGFGGGADVWTNGYLMFSFDIIKRKEFMDLRAMAFLLRTGFISDSLHAEELNARPNEVNLGFGETIFTRETLVMILGKFDILIEFFQGRI